MTLQPIVKRCAPFSTISFPPNFFNFPMWTLSFHRRSGVHLRFFQVLPLTSLAEPNFLFQVFPYTAPSPFPVFRRSLRASSFAFFQATQFTFPSFSAGKLPVFRKFMLPLPPRRLLPLHLSILVVPASLFARRFLLFPSRRNSPLSTFRSPNFVSSIKVLPTPCTFFPPVGLFLLPSARSRRFFRFLHYKDAWSPFFLWAFPFYSLNVSSPPSPIPSVVFFLRVRLRAAFSLE